jgi:hypothetical protein
MAKFNQLFPSPDGSHVARLAMIGEIAWGPSYFALEIDDVSFVGRVFGDSLRWSDDSTMLAVEEWLTTERALGPVTQVTVIDTVRKKQCALTKAHMGFIMITAFAGHMVSFEEEYWARSTVKIDRQLKLPLPGQWTWLDALPRVRNGDITDSG